MLTQLPAANRLILVSTIGTVGDGDSLAGLNVELYPAGVLAYVKSTDRFYRLKKNLDTDVVADSGTYKNVVNSVGSSAVAGRWVACQQYGTAILVGGTLTVVGFDMTSPGFFLVTLITPGGTPGFPRGAKSTDASVAITSTSNSDTGTYGFMFVEGPAA